MLSISKINHHNDVILELNQRKNKDASTENDDVADYSGSKESKM